MNIKKIGMTALAASLVSTSVFAGELTVTGSASMGWENYTTTNAARNNNKGLFMANNIVFSGGGELDNGLTVAVSYELDDGDNSGGDADADDDVWDNHSVSISSDSMGTLTFHGHGGDSAQSAISASAAGNVWDNFDGVGGVTAARVNSLAADDLLVYTTPALIDGLSLSASYNAGGKSTSGGESSTSYAGTYTGVDGLTVSYGVGDNNSSTTNNIEVTSWKVAYAYGPITATASSTEADATTANTDVELESMAVSYTVSENLSVTYGEETISDQTHAVDSEYSSISAAYTSGGMTISVGHQVAENGNGAAADADVDYNYLTLGFAF